MTCVLPGRPGPHDARGGSRGCILGRWPCSPDVCTAAETRLLFYFSSVSPKVTLTVTVLFFFFFFKKHCRFYMFIKFCVSLPQKFIQYLWLLLNNYLETKIAPTCVNNRMTFLAGVCHVHLWNLSCFFPQCLPWPLSPIPSPLLDAKSLYLWKTHWGRESCLKTWISLILVRCHSRQPGLTWIYSFPTLRCHRDGSAIICHLNCTWR